MKKFILCVLLMLVYSTSAYGLPVEGDLDVNGQITISDSATIPPLNLTERSTAPSSPAEGDMYLDDGTNTASTNPGWRRYTGAAWEDVSASSGVAAGTVLEADYDAQTILQATSDDTPVTLTVGEQTLVGRITSGNITALTATEVRTLIDVESGADVTDTGNVTTAGALMDSEVDADLKTFVLPASTTISVYGASVVDDADAATARGTLDVDQAGTDNSTDVTLGGTPDYITITGQVITRGSVDLAADITGNLPVANLNSGTDAGETTYWRGDGTWVTPEGSGDVVGPANAVDSNFAGFDTTTGKLIKDSGSKASDFATALGADENYVSNAELGVVQATSGSNTGDNAGVTSVAGGTGLTSSGGTTPSLSHDSHTGDVTGSTALTIGADKVHDTMIDWGTGAGQVSTLDITEGTDKKFVSDAQLVVIGSTSGANTGDNAGVTSVTGGTAITSSGGTTPSISVTDDAIGDTQLAYNTGQTLTTAGTPTFSRVTASDYGVFVGGVRVGSASDPGANNLSVAGNTTIGGNISAVVDIDSSGDIDTSLSMFSGEVYVVKTNAQLVAAISAAPGTILIANNFTLETPSKIIPSGTTLKAIKGSVIDLDDFDLTIRGNIDIKAQQIFDESGTGVVRFGVSNSSNNSLFFVYPEWWGATCAGVAASATVTTAAFNSAFAAIATRVQLMNPGVGFNQLGGMTLRLSSGTYMLNGSIDVACAVTIKGTGRMYNPNANYFSGSILWQDADSAVFVVEPPNDFGNTLVYMRDFSIYGDYSGAPSVDSDAIRLPDDTTGSVQLTMNDVFIWGNGYGFSEGVHVVAGRLFMDDCKVKGVYNYGIKVDDTDMTILNDCAIEDTGKSGFYSVGLVSFINDMETFRCGNRGSGSTNYYAVEVNRAFIKGGYFNEDYNLVKIGSGSITDSFLEYAGKSGGSYTNPNGIGITVQDEAHFADTVSIIGCVFYQNGGNDINVIEGEGTYQRVMVIGNDFSDAGQGVSSGTDEYCIYQGSGGARMIVSGNTFHGTQTATQGSEVYFAGNHVNFSNNNVVTADTARDAVTFAASQVGEVCIGNNITSGSGKTGLVIGSGAVVEAAGNVVDSTSGKGEFIVQGGVTTSSLSLNADLGVGAYTAIVYMRATGCTSGDTQLSYIAGLGYLCWGDNTP